MSHEAYNQVEISHDGERNEKRNLSHENIRPGGLSTEYAPVKQEVEETLAKTIEPMLMPILLFSEVMMWTLYGNIATFYPPYRTAHHKSISDTMVGVVLAMFEGGVLIFSPIVSLLLPKIGRKNFIIIGNIAMILASAGFGLLVYVEDDNSFFYISVLLRVISGFGDAASSTAIFSIIGSEFPTKRELYFGYFESAVGVGLMLGPVLGQIFYTALGFERTFYCTAGVLGIPFILQLIYIPNRLNTSSYGGEEDEKNSQNVE